MRGLFRQDYVGWGPTGSMEVVVFLTWLHEAVDRGESAERGLVERK